MHPPEDGRWEADGFSLLQGYWRWKRQKLEKSGQEQLPRVSVMPPGAEEGRQPRVGGECRGIAGPAAGWLGKPRSGPLRVSGGSRARLGKVFLGA